MQIVTGTHKTRPINTLGPQVRDLTSIVATTSQ